MQGLESYDYISGLSNGIFGKRGVITYAAIYSQWMCIKEENDGYTVLDLVYFHYTYCVILTNVSLSFRSQEKSGQ